MAQIQPSFNIKLKELLQISKTAYFFIFCREWTESVDQSLTWQKGDLRILIRVEYQNCGVDHLRIELCEIVQCQLKHSLIGIDLSHIHILRRYRYDLASCRALNGSAAGQRPVSWQSYLILPIYLLGMFCRKDNVPYFMYNAYIPVSF